MQLLGLVGAVGVHLADHVVAGVERHPEAVQVGRAQAGLVGAVQDRDLRVGGGEPVGDVAGAVGRAVVDDEDVDVGLRRRAAGRRSSARLAASL